MARPNRSLEWTLNYEMFFYVVFAFATLLSQRWAVLAVTAFFIAVLTLPGALAIPIVYPFAGWFSSFIYEFAFGMWIALAFREGLRLPRWVSCALLLSGVALLMDRS